MKRRRPSRDRSIPRGVRSKRIRRGGIDRLVCKRMVVFIGARGGRAFSRVERRSFLGSGDSAFFDVFDRIGWFFGVFDGKMTGYANFTQ